MTEWFELHSNSVAVEAEELYASFRNHTMALIIILLSHSKPEITVNTNNGLSTHGPVSRSPWRP